MSDLPDIGKDTNPEELQKYFQLNAQSGNRIPDSMLEQMIRQGGSVRPQGGVQGGVSIPVGQGRLSLEGLINYIKQAGVVGGGRVGYTHPLDSTSNISGYVGGGGSSKYGGGISDAMIQYNKRF